MQNPNFANLQCHVPDFHFNGNWSTDIEQGFLKYEAMPEKEIQEGYKFLLQGLFWGNYILATV